MIRGVIFDLDGTLFDSDYDWPAIKASLGVADPGGSILDHLATLPEEERRRKEETLREIETRATREGRLKPGAGEVTKFLRRNGVKLALVTNNHRECVDWFLSRHPLGFDLVMTRECGVYKPSPAPLLRAAAELSLTPAEIVMVGDNEFDNRAGHEAGMGLVVIVRPDRETFAGRCDHALRDLFELRALFEDLLRRRG